MVRRPRPDPPPPSPLPAAEVLGVVGEAAIPPAPTRIATLPPAEPEKTQGGIPLEWLSAMAVIPFLLSALLIMAAVAPSWEVPRRVFGVAREDRRVNVLFLGLISFVCGLFLLLPFALRL